MDKVGLGRTGINVTPVCFGSLTISPLQSGISIDEGAEVIAYALERGINFIDTAQLYDTYNHIKRASEISNKDFHISTKSYAYTKEQAESSLEEARRALNRDVIDIFMLHEQESVHTLRGHREALEYYLDQKEKGRILAVGVSTHNICGVEAASAMGEIDVIHPIINLNGTGIGDGTIDRMLEAIEKAYHAGKGIFSMKPLGGGCLHKDYVTAMDFIRKNSFIHSVAIGMKTIDEVEMNILFFERREIPSELTEKIALQDRKLHIEFWCTSCGRCIKRCRQDALHLNEGRVQVNAGKCILCGYCVPVCPEFAIKIF
jgi:uncharacterized protein